MLANMRILRWTSGVMREDNSFHKRGQRSIVDKIRENTLRWFGHVMNREESETVRIKINVGEKSGRERPKSRWLDAIKNNTRADCV